MRVCRYTDGESVSYGIVEGGHVRQLQGCPLVDGLTETDRVSSLSDIHLVAPLEPPNILAIGLNYREHAEETGADLPDHPLLFIKATSAVTDPGAPIVLPGVAPDEVDYEAELAVIIGRKAKKVKAAAALDYVYGYTVGNDVTARDCQKRRDRQWARAKSFDTFCPLGPWIETDLDPSDAKVKSTLNGEVMQSSTTADLIFGVCQLIEHLSENITLLPGTVIMTGTPPGVGVARSPQRFLRPGDVIEVSVEGIGTLMNPVVADTDG